MQESLVLLEGIYANQHKQIIILSNYEDNKLLDTLNIQEHTIEPKDVSEKRKGIGCGRNTPRKKRLRNNHDRRSNRHNKKLYF
jgi:hypothetical protein